jgi:hypothetical protein
MTAAWPWPDDRAGVIPVRPVNRTHVKIDRSGLLSTGLRRKPGEPVILYSAEDASLDADAARRLCGHLLWLHREGSNGRSAARRWAPIHVPLAQPKQCSPEYRVWPVAPGVDVVHLAPGLGWVAAARPIIVKDRATRWRLIEALAALATELDRDRQTAVVDDPTTGPLCPPRVGGGARVLYSGDTPPQGDDALTDEDSKVLDAVQVITEFETRNWWAEASEALAGSDGYFQYRLTLWPQPTDTVPWMLLRQEVNHPEKEKVTIFGDAMAAVLAFESELVDRVRSGRKHLVTRTPWRIWHTARQHAASNAGTSAVPAMVLAWQNEGRDDAESRPRRYVNLSAPRW